MALAIPQSGPDMAVSGRRRSDEDRVVRYLNTEGDFEVEVSHTLNKWCVTVFQLPSKQVVAQDFFPERWKALARAQDFVRILNTRNKPHPEALGLRVSQPIGDGGHERVADPMPLTKPDSVRLAERQPQGIRLAIA